MLFTEIERRQTILSLVVSEREAQAVKDAAQKAGISMSRFMRSALRRELSQCDQKQTAAS